MKCTSKFKAVTSQGIGLVEILVAVAIIGVLLAVAGPAMADFMERRRVVAVAGELSSLFTFARSETNVIGTGIQVHLQKNEDGQTVSCAAVAIAAIIPTCKCFRDPSDICPTSGGGELLRLFQLPYDSGVKFEASATRWVAAQQVLSFKRLKGPQNDENVKVNVKGTRTGAELEIDINDAGLVTICSKVGRLGGFPTCA